MSPGDLVYIVAANDSSKHGIGLYLGTAHRGYAPPFMPERYKYYHAFLWKGRVATFDKPYWLFEVISCGK